MLVDIEKIKIKERIRKDFGNIEELAKDIKENSLLNPITVIPLQNNEYQLIAGERRLRACKFLGMTNIIVNTITVKDAEQALRIEIAENENRKEFSFSERMEWARRLEEIESLKASERMKNPTKNSSEGETAEIVAKESGFGSKDTYRKAKFINDLADPEIIKQLDEKQISIHAAYQKLKREKEEMERIANVQLEKNEMLRSELEENESKLISKYENKIKQKEDQYNNLNERVRILNEKIELYEKDTQKYNQLKSQIEYLTKEKDDIGRQIESAVSLSGYIVEIEEFLKNKLAPIKYSRAMLESSENPTVIKNVTNIVECVELWCSEIRRLIPNINNRVIIESEEI